jgi:hypothetical protein
MFKPGKSMAKNANSKFTTRNNKQDIFSSFTKSPSLKIEFDKRTTDVCKPETNNPNS